MLPLCSLIYAFTTLHSLGKTNETFGFSADADTKYYLKG